MIKIDNSKDIDNLIESGFVGEIIYKERKLKIFRFAFISRSTNYHRQYYADRRKRGLCVVCGRKSKEHIKCKRCNKRERENWFKNYHNKNKKASIRKR